MMELQSIVSKLPYTEPFLFVDMLEQCTPEAVKGSYTFRKEAYFYKGHFKDAPITPGVILIECMAQIGLVCMGISILAQSDLPLKVAMSSAEVDFLKPVFPETRVMVTSERVYFRFNKLKCKVVMEDDSGEIVAKGEISGMVFNEDS